MQYYFPKGMEQLVRSGLVRSVGIANFNKKQILRILECCDIPPAVLQIESHPYFLNDKIITFARGAGMQVTAHAVLGSAYRDVCVIIVVPSGGFYQPGCLFVSS